MYIYIRKLFPNDADGGQISFPRDVAQYFFNAPESFLSKQQNYTVHFLSLINTTSFRDIELQPATDFRFSTHLNTFLLENGQRIEVGDLLYVERFRRAFGVKLVKPEEAGYATFDALLNEHDRHFLLCNDDDERETPQEEAPREDQAESSDFPTDGKHKEYLELLKENHNLILTGAPGTGKTHLAKELAAEIGAETQFVQFHPSYDYTDFVEGLRPVDRSDSSDASDSSVPFERKDGIFKRFCKAAILYSLKAIAEDNEDEEIGSFEYVYNSLKEEIVSGVTTEFSKSGTLSVDGDKRIVYHWKKSQKKIKEDNVRILYEHFLSQGATSLDGITGDELQRILKEKTLAERGVATKRIDKSEYLWTVDALLKRKAALTEGTYKKEEKTSNKPFVFIIDEINRGELSKIFGELFFAIDPGYRGEQGKVSTQYQELISDDNDIFKAGFYIPDNVYIIGTMNDIDRSVESMDFAVRRRFAWREVTAAQSAENMGLSDEVKTRMARVNAAILKCDLTSAYFIGGAYFLKLKDNDYESLWNNHIKGLVEEYFRGNPDGPEYVEKIHTALVSNQE